AHPGREPDHPAERPRPADGERGLRPGHRLDDPGLGGVGGREVHAGGGVLAPAHSTRPATATWVRSWKAATRASTSPSPTSSNPRMPKWAAANEPIVAP